VFLHWNEKTETAFLGSWHLANDERNGAACGYTPFYQRWIKTYTLKDSAGVPQTFCEKCRAIHDGFEVDIRMINVDAPAPYEGTHRLYEYTITDTRAKKRQYVELLAWCVAHVRWAHIEPVDSEPFVYDLSVRADGKWSYKVLERHLAAVADGEEHGQATN
jgi:hypothetical protein